MKYTLSFLEWKMEKIGKRLQFVKLQIWFYQPTKNLRIVLEGLASYLFAVLYTQFL